MSSKLAVHFTFRVFFTGAETASNSPIGIGREGSITLSGTDIKSIDTRGSGPIDSIERLRRLCALIDIWGGAAATGAHTPGFTAAVAFNPKAGSSSSDQCEADELDDDELDDESELVDVDVDNTTGFTGAGFCGSDLSCRCRFLPALRPRRR
jgi:hypothetical protein